jgi:hypothetical protein
MLLALLCLLSAASVLCAATVIACTVWGGRNLSGDLREEPMEWHVPTNAPTPVDTIAPHHI